MAKRSMPSQSTSLLERVAAAIPKKSGSKNWLDELQAKNDPHLLEVIELLADWGSGQRVYTAKHSRTSLAKFLSSLDFCNRTQSGLVAFLRQIESGEVDVESYR